MEETGDPSNIFCFREHGHFLSQCLAGLVGIVTILVVYNLFRYNNWPGSSGDYIFITNSKTNFKRVESFITNNFTKSFASIDDHFSWLLNPRFRPHRKI